VQRLPEVSLLKLDKDCYVEKSWINDWIRLAALPICSNFGTRVDCVRMTKTRKGIHFYVAIGRPVRAELANRIQWLLGDDCRRVDFNRARIRVCYPRWNKLFEEENVSVATVYPIQGSGRNTNNGMPMEVNRQW
jgi:hypothetical protein